MEWKNYEYGHFSRSAQHLVRYILTKQFCRELPENYFGTQCSLGARKRYKDNPSSKDLDVICMKHHIYIK